MKRQKHRAKRTGSQPPKGTAVASPPPAKSGRRSFLKLARNGAIGAVVVGGGGWYLVQDVSARIREHDLTRIGNGVPTVVQIHDPQCPQCTALQREARRAMSDFDDSELQYLVADINRFEGRRLAAAHGVGHVTLLLFDAEGEMRGALVGPNDSDYLAQEFRRHLADSGPS